MPEITTNSEKETFAWAEKYAREFRGGEVIGLSGDLGAGKTVFAKGLARGLGVREAVTSPTFVLMKVYDIMDNEAGIKVFCHIDAYRLGRPEELEAIGAGEYFTRPDCVTVVEWAGRIGKILPPGHAMINIKHINLSTRAIIIDK